MASPNLTELVATTLRNRKAKPADQITKSNAFLMTLEDTGKITNAGGGRELTRW